MPGPRSRPPCPLRALSRAVPLVSALALAAALSASCSAASAVGGLRVVSNVPDATLLVDEEVQGPARAYEGRYLPLAPGPHRVTLEHPDYFPEYVEVTVQDNMAMAVRVEMRRRPEE